MLFFTPLFAMAGSCSAQGTPDLPPAESILERLEARIGEPAARAKVKNLVLRGSMAIPGVETVPFEELYSAGAEGERVLVTFDSPGWGKTTQGTDGQVSWTADPGFGVQITEGDEQGGARRQWAINRRAPWRSLYAKAETLGLTECDGGTAYELAMTPKSGSPERWFVERETSDLVGIAVALPNPLSRGPLPMQVFYSDWKSIDGVRYAHRRVTKVAGLDMMVTTVEAIEHPTVLDPARLAPPPEVVEAIRDKSKRAPRPTEDPEECGLETVEARSVASIRTVIDSRKMSEELGVLFPEVVRVMGEQGVQPSGPPFSRLHRIDREKNEIDVEAGLPVRSPITAQGRVKPGELPGGRVARTWHAGEYHELPRSYARLESWMKSQKLAARAPFWEVYWTDPGIEPDPKNWLTQILWPVE